MNGRVSELVSSRISQATANVRAYGDAFYNVMARPYEAHGDGLKDDTAIFQKIVDDANAAGRRAVYCPYGTYYVTALTNDANIIWFGDNATFTGGYGGTINQMGTFSDVTEADFNALKADVAQQFDEVDTAISLKANQSALDLTNSNLTNGLSSKVDKNGAGQVTWAMAAQDFREQITGGNTAVVGVDAVSTTNIVNNSVTSVKRTTLGEEAYMYTPTPVDINFVSGNIEIPTGFKFVVWRNKSYTLTSSAITIPKSGSTIAGYLAFNWVTNTIELLVTTTATENHVILGYIHTTVRVCNFAYTVNGKADIIGPIDNVTSKWYGKNGVTFGDSIPWYDGKAFVNTHIEYGQIAKGYQSYMREKLGCTVDNQGVSSVDITQIFSSKISTYDFTDIDFVTLTSGANDHRKGIPLGVIADIGTTFNTSTFFGALQASVEKVLTDKPTIKIYLLTPIKGWYHEEGTSDVPNPNGEGILSVDYVNAIIAVGELYSLPVLDWYHLSTINDISMDVYIGDNPAVFTAYSLHPTNAGYKRMADVLIPFLNNY